MRERDNMPGAGPDGSGDPTQAHHFTIHEVTTDVSRDGKSFEPCELVLRVDAATGATAYLDYNRFGRWHEGNLLQWLPVKDVTQQPETLSCELCGKWIFLTEAPVVIGWHTTTTGELRQRYVCRQCSKQYRYDQDEASVVADSTTDDDDGHTTA